MPNAFVDRLEPRVCFAAGPVVTSQLLVGGVDSITALVISFSGPMDPATAGNVENYRFGGSRGSGRTAHKAPLAAAQFDPATNTVTLTTIKAFPVTRFKRLTVIVAGTRPGHVADANGNLLDGNRDGEAGGTSDTRFKIARGTGLSYRDADGDRVSLRLRGGAGRPMTSIVGPNRNVHQVWVGGENNVVTGTIRKGRRGDGQTFVGRVVLEHPTNSSELANPFFVGQTVVDGQVAVDPLVRTL